jgi:ElaB/YqjD/DUF883 family membrane-anchored ribosome-binding protein
MAWTDTMLQSLPPLGEIADGLSVAGFLMSLYVTTSIWTIRRKYARKGRLPQVHEKLSDAASDLNKFLTESQGTLQQTEARMKTSALTPHLRDVMRYTSGKPKKHSNELIKKIERLQNRTVVSKVSESDGWDCYQEAKNIATMVESFAQDDAWKS